MSIIKCLGFSVGFLVVWTSKSLTPCAGCYAFSICRGVVIGLAGLYSGKKLRKNDPCHSDIGTAPRRQNVCWRGAWIILEFRQPKFRIISLLGCKKRIALRVPRMVLGWSLWACYGTFLANLARVPLTIGIVADCGLKIEKYFLSKHFSVNPSFGAEWQSI